jgi:hypothetical protein
LKTQCCWVICQFQTLLKQVIPLISLKIVWNGYPLVI